MFQHSQRKPTKHSKIIHEQSIQIQLDIATQFPANTRATQLEVTESMGNRSCRNEEELQYGKTF